MFRVLMPIDGNESRGAAQADAVRAMPNASEGIEVTLLHVFDDGDQADTTSPRQIPGGREAYDRLTDASIRVEQESRNGDPAAEILAAAEEINADHIVLGGRKRSPARSALFGSVSMEVMRNANRPVTITGETE